jgi:glycosyltransferase involved in cell wall biosynthesis
VTDLRVCTIVTSRTVAEAGVLADTVLANATAVELVALWLDWRPPIADHLASWELLTPGDLGVAAEAWHRLAVVLPPTALAAAMRPHLLAAMFERSTAPVVFLDATAQVYGPLDRLFDADERADLALVPKTLQPVPDDGLEPSQQQVTATGLFDAGVIGVRNGARPFLDFWAGTSRWQMAEAEVRHADSWLDVATLYARTHVVRDPGFGVAYWNLHERQLEEVDGDRVLVAGQPLRVMHYRGFDPERPYLLTTEVEHLARVEAIDDPVLRALCADRARRLASRSAASTERGNARTAKDVLPNGLRLDDEIRALYCHELIAAGAADRPLPPDPFAPGGDAALVEWLNEPVAGAPDAPVSRYLHWVWQGRPDLQLAVPDPLGAGAADLFAWSRSAEDFSATCQPLLSPLPTAPARPPSHLLPGYNLVGFLAAEFGLGDMARAILSSVSAAGVPVATRSITAWTQARQQASFRDSGDRGLPYRVNLLATMANETAIMARDPATRWMLEDRYNVGLWFWEVDRFNAASLEAFRWVDEVWVATDYMREIFEKASDRPVRKYTFPVLVIEDPTHLTRADLGLPEGFLFGFVFDFLSVVDRKNPMGLVQAYRAAFGPDDGARLVIKSTNAGRRRADAAQLYDAIDDREDIVLLDGFMSAIEMQSLFQHFDCYASLHRSEGFGATMARSMACAKPTIATAYSGNLDFMADDVCYLVPYRLVEVGPGADPYPPDATWAEPDIAAAADLMRRVYDDQDEARRRGQLARERIRTTHSVERASGFFAEQFDRIFFDG